MKNKLVLLTGVGIGYVLGTRAGREQYERIRAQARSWWGDPRVQDQVAGAQAAVKAQAPVAAAKVTDAARSAVDAATPGRRDPEVHDAGSGI